MTAALTLQAPFPYFGGKSRVTSLVWPRFGAVRNYVEPFAGSLAMLLGRPLPFVGQETANDADGLICNFWRAVQWAPESVARFADWPVNECDLSARHSWLVARKETVQKRIEADPDYFDAKVAGWWVWGICAWIGSGFCSGKGPWHAVVADDGFRQLVHLGTGGQGVNRKLVHLGTGGQGVNRQLVHLGTGGRGVNRKRVAELETCEERTAHLIGTMQALADRLRRVRVCCGDWSRVCGPTPTVKQGLTAVFLDPPYADTAERAGELYRKDDETVAHQVREWAIERGDDSKMRIALCGYEGEHRMPRSWQCVAWKAQGGFANQSKAPSANARRERIWFSPHCLKASRA